MTVAVQATGARGGAQLTEARDPGSTIFVGDLLGWRDASYYEWLEAQRRFMERRRPGRSYRIVLDPEFGTVALWERT